MYMFNLMCMSLVEKKSTVDISNAHSGHSQDCKDQLASHPYTGIISLLSRDGALPLKVK